MAKKIPAIIKSLQNLEKSELFEVVLELVKMDKKNEQFVKLFILPPHSNNINEVITEAKKKIYLHFYNQNGLPRNSVSLTEARNIIKEYSKVLKKSPLHAADIKLYYVETVCEILADFGGDDQRLVNSGISMLRQFDTDIMNRPEYYKNFEERLDELSTVVQNIGYGFDEFFFETISDLEIESEAQDEDDDDEDQYQNEDKE